MAVQELEITWTYLMDSFVALDAASEQPDRIIGQGRGRRDANDGPT
jgi:hypothetical protein